MDNNEKDVIDFELQFYKEFKEQFKGQISDNQFYDEFNNAISSGKREVYQKRISEGQAFDGSWVNRIEFFLPYLDRIVRNPKAYMVAQEDVVRIDQARKINARSVIHLSTHTEYVETIQADGVIVPRKVLTTHYEDTIAIYENRFIMTLIAKLAAFVEIRYEVIKAHQESYTADRINVNSSFNWRNYDIDVDFNIRVKEIDDAAQSNANKKLLDRIEEIRKFTKVFINSPLYKELRATSMPVSSPLLKTNILLHNVDYVQCVQLWDYLDSYRDLGFAVNTSEKELKLDDSYLQTINDLIIFNYSAFVENQEERAEDYKLLKYKPRKAKQATVIKNIDDEYLEPGVYGMEFPSVNEYFYNQIVSVEKDQITALVEDGKTFNQAAITTYKRMQTIANSAYEDILKTIEPDYEKEDSFKEKRKAKYDALKKKFAIMKRVYDIKKAELEKTLKSLEKIESELEHFATQEKELSQELSKIKRDIAKKERAARKEIEETKAQLLREQVLENQRLGELVYEKDKAEQEAIAQLEEDKLYEEEAKQYLEEQKEQLEEASDERIEQEREQALANPQTDETIEEPQVTETEENPVEETTPSEENVDEVIEEEPQVTETVEEEQTPVEQTAEEEELEDDTIDDVTDDPLVNSIIQKELAQLAALDKRYNRVVTNYNNRQLDKVKRKSKKERELEELQQLNSSSKGYRRSVVGINNTILDKEKRPSKQERELNELNKLDKSDTRRVQGITRK